METVKLILDHPVHVIVWALTIYAVWLWLTRV